MIAIRLAAPADRSRVQEFYRAVGYGREISAADRVILAEEDGKIVGLLRLAFEEGVTVLRGVRVVEALQRRGVGTQLLERTASELGDAACWCIPYRHLTSFYGQIGFREIDPSSAPAFLADRLATYRRERPDVSLCLMLRPAPLAL
jgi:N-acetylglutamate synthase-like GNAT family acetyltransferase